MKRLLPLSVLIVLLVACGSHRWVRFALSDHPTVLKRVQADFQTAGIRCIEGDFNLGVMTLLVDSRDFEHARHSAETLIARDSLTVRITKNVDARVYEVYQSGKWIRDESYIRD